jgi:hypothetical protein
LIPGFGEFQNEEVGYTHDHSGEFREVYALNPEYFTGFNRIISEQIPVSMIKTGLSKKWGLKKIMDHR